MAELMLTPENQIQRLNLIFHKVERLQGLSIEELLNPSRPKSWSVLEVIEHLNIAYSFYGVKIDGVLDSAPESGKDPWIFKARNWQRMIITGQRPKDGRRPFKIKTLKRFRPVLVKDQRSKEQAIDIFERFHECYGHLKKSISQSRSKVVKTKKITSAIGPIVQFYLPEAFEFLISHAERHMVQIDEILSQQSMEYL